MSWSRAVWKEGSKTVEGVVPSIWVCSQFVKWPRKNERTAFKERTKPCSDWSLFQLVKVKFTSETKGDCEEYNDTTSVETEFEEDPVSQKREKSKKSFGEDFTTFSEVERGNVARCTTPFSNHLPSGKVAAVDYPPLPKKFKKSSDCVRAQQLLEAQPKISSDDNGDGPNTSSSAGMSANGQTAVPASQHKSLPVLGGPAASNSLVASRSHKSPVARTASGNDQHGCSQKVAEREKTPGSGKNLIGTPVAASTDQYGCSQKEAERAKTTGSGKSLIGTPVAASNDRYGCSQKVAERAKTPGSRKNLIGTPVAAKSQRRSTSDEINSNLASRILMELAKMNGEIRQLRRVIERQQQPLARPSLSMNVEDAVPQLVDGPVDTLEDIRSLLQCFRHKDQQDSLFNLLIANSGDDMEASVRIVMQRIMTNNAMSYINLDGRGGKLAFRKSPLCGVVTDVVVSQHPGSSVTSVHSYMSRYFKSAPWRDGGAGKGCHMQEKMNIADNVMEVAEQSDREIEQDDAESLNASVDSASYDDMTDVESDSV